MGEKERRKGNHRAAYLWLSLLLFFDFIYAFPCWHFPAANKETIQTRFYVEAPMVYRGRPACRICLQEGDPASPLPFKRKSRLLLQEELRVGAVYEGELTLFPFKRPAYRSDFDELSFYRGRGIAARAEGGHFRQLSQPSALKVFFQQTVSYLQGKTEVIGGPKGELIHQILFGRLAANDLALKEPLKDLGLSYFLAVSGFQIRLFFSWGLSFLSFLPFSRQTLSFFLLSILLLYSAALGFPPAVLKAILLLGYQELAIARKRKAEPGRQLLLCLYLILLFKPYAVFDLGLQLSFLTSLVGLAVQELNTSRPLERPLARKLRPSLWIQAAFLPFSVRLNGGLSLTFILASFFSWPLYQQLFKLGLLSYLFSFLPLSREGPYQLFFLPYELIYRLFQAMLEGLSHLPLSLHKEAASLSSSSWLLYFLLLLLFYMGYSGWWKERQAGWVVELERRRRQEREEKFLTSFFSLGLILSLAGLLSPLFQPPTLYAMEVGQGDGFLLQCGQTAFLFDCGGQLDYRSLENTQAASLAQDMREMGIRKIGAAFLSHADYDHMGNLAGLASCFPLSAIYTGPAEPDKAKKDFAWAGEGKLHFLGEGEQMKWQLSSLFRRYRFSLSVIYSGQYGAEEGNNESAILLLDFGPRVLFMGDLEEDSRLTEDPWREAHLSADILKAAHHGSAKGTSTALLEAVRPEAVLISCGQGNSYGHPSQPFLDRIGQAGLPLYRTDRQGRIAIRPGRGAAFRLETSRQKRSRELWLASCCLCLYWIFLKELGRSYPLVGVEVQGLSLGTDR